MCGRLRDVLATPTARRPVMEPSRATLSGARSGIPPGKDTLPHHLDTRTRRRGAPPVHGTLRFAARKERAAAREPALRRGAPVFLLSPSKMAVNRCRVVIKARFRASVSARVRAALAEAECAATAAESAVAEGDEILRPAGGPVAGTEAASEEGDGPARTVRMLAPGGNNTDVGSSGSEEGEILFEGRACGPRYPSVARVNARTASEEELSAAFRDGFRQHGPGILLEEELVGKGACVEVAKATRSVTAAKANAMFKNQSVYMMEELQQSEPDSGNLLRRQALLAGPGLINLDDILKQLRAILFAVIRVQ